jgi:hypothetical protein
MLITLLSGCEFLRLLQRPIVSEPSFQFPRKAGIGAIANKVSLSEEDGPK